MLSGARELPDDVVDSLVMALLGVNNYPLEKVWNLLPRLREGGLTQPSQVASEDLNRLTARLITAGYDRGRLTGMLAERLQHLMTAIASGRLDDLCRASTRKDATVVQRMLCEIRGIGPQVAQNAWMLLQESAEN
jgi:3-methyladenine DNA glycosylase/8-oxoguanine DNA glycosylase